MSYDAQRIVAAKLAEVQSTIASRLSTVTSTTGISFSAVLRTAAAAGSDVDAQEDIVEAAPASVETERTPALQSSSQVESLAAAAGEEYGVDPSLILALIWAESGGLSDAVSQAGAMGLMQLMPSTAEALGVQDPFSPEQNVDGGARLLSSLLERYNGDMRLAVAAYNCGVGGLGRLGVTSLDTQSELSLLPQETQSLISRVEAYLLSRGYSAT